MQGDRGIVAVQTRVEQSAEQRLADTRLLLHALAGEGRFIPDEAVASLHTTCDKGLLDLVGV